MQENLQTLLQALRNERLKLEGEKVELSTQYGEFRRSRQGKARECLRNLVPNLEPKTIRRIQCEVPEFPIPMVSRWFGFSKKIDPKVSLDTFRIQLGTYLDNTKVSMGWSPEEWREVVRYDELIRSLQEKLIPANAERLTDIGTRITAIEKLLRVDVAKMDPKVRAKLEQAVASQAKKTHQSAKPSGNFRSAVPVNTSYPSHTEINSDSGPSLLEMWFWWQILTPQSECSHEVGRIESGGGDFGGAGASGNWDSPDIERPASEASSFVSDVAPVVIQADAINQTEEAQLAVQAELGSQSFS